MVGDAFNDVLYFHIDVSRNTWHYNQSKQMNAYIEILIITELKYVRIPTYVVEIYTPEKTHSYTKLLMSNWKEKGPQWHSLIWFRWNWYIFQFCFLRQRASRKMIIWCCAPTLDTVRYRARCMQDGTQCRYVYITNFCRLAKRKWQVTTVNIDKSIEHQQSAY